MKNEEKAEGVGKRQATDLMLCPCLLLLHHLANHIKRKLQEGLTTWPIYILTRNRTDSLSGQLELTEENRVVGLFCLCPFGRTSKANICHNMQQTYYWRWQARVFVRCALLRRLNIISWQRWQDRHIIVQRLPTINRSDFTMFWRRWKDRSDRLGERDGEDQKGRMRGGWGKET